MLLDILAHYPLAMGSLLGEVHLSELEILYKPCATARLERPTIRSSVQDNNGPLSHLITKTKTHVFPIWDFVVMTLVQEF